MNHRFTSSVLLVSAIALCGVALADPAEESQKIEPLDPWEAVDSAPPPVREEKPETKEAPKEAPEKQLTIDDLMVRGKELDVEEEPDYNDPEPVAGEETNPHYKELPGKESVLSRTERDRLSDVKKTREKIEQRIGRKQPHTEYRDSRGEPELTLCEVNLQFYSTPGKSTKLVARKRSSFLAPLEKRFVAAVKKASCDVIVVQGVVGKDLEGVEENFARLAKVLKKSNGSEWQYRTALSVQQYSGIGFLIREREGLAIENTVFHSDKTLPRIVGFAEKKFARAPFELTVRVTSRNSEGEKTFNIFGFDFQTQLEPTQLAAQNYRIQLAEAIRQLAINSQTASNGNLSGNVVVVAGDRRAKRGTATSRVLEGLIRLNDFRRGKPCTINGVSEEFSCDPKPQNPKTLFPLLGDDLPPGPKEISKKEKGKWVKVLEKPNLKVLEQLELKRVRRTVDIYLLERDLRLAEKNERKLSRYAVGYEPLIPQLKDTPLVWAKFNW